MFLTRCTDGLGVPGDQDRFYTRTFADRGARYRRTCSTWSYGKRRRKERKKRGKREKKRKRGSAVLVPEDETSVGTEFLGATGTG